jgi:CxxC motif-containing protein
MPNPDLSSNYCVRGAIAPNAIVKFGANVQLHAKAVRPSVTLAAGATDILVGVTTAWAVPRELHSRRLPGGTAETIPPVVDTSTADVIHSGSALMQLGAPVKAGDFVTSDAQGYGTPATAGDRTIGVALEDGIVGEMIEVMVAIGQLAPSTPARAAK